MLRPFARNHNNVGTCWHLLRSLKPVKLLGPCKRTEHCWPQTLNNTQQCCDFDSTSHPNESEATNLKLSEHSVPATCMKRMTTWCSATYALSGCILTVGLDYSPDGRLVVPSMLTTKETEKITSLLHITS